MPKQRDPLAELEAAYQEHVELVKSRRKVKKAKEEGEDDPPADDDNMKQYNTDRDEEEDNDEEMEEQYGDTEPEDDADEEADKKAAKRQKRAYDEDETKKSRKARKSRRRDDDEDDKDEDEDEDEVKKSRRVRKSDAATRAIRDSQDSYLDEDDDDDLHGYAEDMDEEQGDGDDETIITNMGRRVRPGVKKSMRDNFYGDLVKSTGFDADFFDANPAVERMSDIVGDYLDAADRRVARLTKSINVLAKSQAALLRSNMALQQQIDTLSQQPADQPHPGFQTPYFQVDEMAKSQAKQNKGTSKLTKSLVREKLTKGMVSQIVEPYVLSDFDAYTARGLTPDEWVANTLDEHQRQALGL